LEILLRRFENEVFYQVFYDSGEFDGIGVRCVADLHDLHGIHESCLVGIADSLNSFTEELGEFTTLIQFERSVSK
jgi:hypothetical protein